MRLFVDKIYRAFPELDPFDDDQCKRMMHGVRKAKPWGTIATLAWIGVSVLISAFMSVVAMMIVVETVFDQTRSDGLVIVSTILTIAVSAGLPMLFAFLARHRWLRKALVAHLKQAKSVCGYSLLGLTIEDGAVQCPECGERIRLVDRGLTPEMLLAGESARESR